MRIAVIGGGIGGLTAALAFAMQGASVCVYERAEAIRAFGAGLQITPNGMRALIALGLEPEALGPAALAVEPMDALSGRRVARFDLTRRSPAYRFVHRGTLTGALAQAAQAAGARIETGAAVDVADLGAADLVIGADGLHSATRSVLNGADAPFFTGQVAWRAIVPVAAPPVARIWMAPGRHLVSYPLSAQEVNLVAVEEREAWAAEGWSHADDPAHLRAAFADCAPAVQALLAQVETPHLWGLFRHPVAARWVGERLAILGDAAHPTLPFLAQGANLAIEDAFVLARCVSDLGTEAGLPRYEALRRPRVARAIAAANANARNYHLAGPARRVAHIGLTTLSKIAPDAFLNRLSWLYDHDVTTEDPGAL